MSKRKILALLLAVAMICSLFVSPALAAEDAGEPVAISDNAGPLFTDIEGHWAESAINRWADYGIIKGDGDGTVRPNRTLKRDELATILTRLLGLKETAPAGTFKDVPADAWYADAVLKCAAAGIMLGDGAGHANPESTIDRQQAIVMVARALGAKASNSKSLNTFKDGDAVADWAAPYLAALTDMGILNGLPDGDGFVVAPEDNINRAGLFALLDKAIGQYVVTPATVTVNDPNKFVVINTDAGEDVTVTGKTAGIVVGAGSTDDVILDNATVGTLKVDAPVDIIIKKGSAVTDLEANAATKVTNNGTVTNLNTNADDVTFDGNKPAAVNTAEDVEPAKDSKGNEVTPPTTSTGSSGGSSSSTTARADIVAATIADHAETGAIAAEDLGKVTVSSSKVSGTTNEYNVTITGDKIMNHTNASSTGTDGHWVGFGMPAAPEGESYTFMVGETDKTADITSREQVVGDKTYNTVYFSGTEEEFKNDTVDVTVKNGDDIVAVYHVSFNVTFYKLTDVKISNVVPEDHEDYNAVKDALIADATVNGLNMTLAGEIDPDKLVSGIYSYYYLTVSDKNIVKLGNTASAPGGFDAEVEGGLVVATRVLKDNELRAVKHIYTAIDAAGRVQDTITVTVDSTACTVKGMKKVTFKDGDKVLKMVTGATGATVTAPATPASTEDVYYTGAWLNADDEVVTTFAVGAEDATYTAQSFEITAQATATRPAGDPENFDYPGKYAELGLTLEANVLTVDAKTLIDAETVANELVQTEGYAQYIFYGVEYTKPADATHAVVSYGKTLTEFDDAEKIAVGVSDSSDGGTSVYNGHLIDYLPVAYRENSVWKFFEDEATFTRYIKWMKDDKVLSVTKAVITLNVKPATFTVTFKDGDTTVGTVTVDYNSAEWTLADAPTNGNDIFLGWFHGDTKVTAPKALTADLTLTAKWQEVVILTAVPYDFSCPDGTTQYITFTLKNGNEAFYVANSTVKECWFRAGRAADGEWTKDEGVELFAGNIDDDSAFEGMDKAHQLGWTVSRRTNEKSTGYYRFVGADDRIYEVTIVIPQAIANDGVAWGDTLITADKPVTAIPVAVPTTTPEQTPENNDETDEP